ncbi:ergothioneine biosynthesis protein EgtB [Pedobacter cryoconitis]|uniref:Ergothioneine biosynthesis protein EgtB n=1 Tax=Pedobacter cryoconitis TaxID=188932 RepID=A0A7W8YP37_9SPHI|nr:ergothioneine biosynthesis protein EgtB [Pedobacter cryoconitis]MBB5619233.1 ergothioneine biosynthesis protein EgtB [Pedobacter cryoconitis]MBB5644529.1 ergothioneine biosynthesis protein EgtB [Pedobacter cryoconitis]
MSLWEQYSAVRSHSVLVCDKLQKEDYVVQPAEEVSPPKWHLGHTTWFFETFILIPHAIAYQPFNPDYNYVFNSYYESIGARVIRTDRGNLSRPTVDEIFHYRAYVDEAMEKFLLCGVSKGIEELLILGLNHEQQHQELLWYDIKYILGHNPLFPAYAADNIEKGLTLAEQGWVEFKEGVHEVGYQGDSFHFDNELGRHKVYIQNFSISTRLVSNAEYVEFIKAGGYQDFSLWHAQGWDWVNEKQINAPLYWYEIEGQWHRYSLSGLESLKMNSPVSNISYYEASAYAQWKGMRLPTEFEWEVASSSFEWGKLWEWTESAYLPYPGFSKAAGALGEYNGKFMVNQKVLRGASIATPANHSRNTYRNFFHPDMRWMFSGIRLSK